MILYGGKNGTNSSYIIAEEIINTSLTNEVQLNGIIITRAAFRSGEKPHAGHEDDGVVVIRVTKKITARLTIKLVKCSSI